MQYLGHVVRAQNLCTLCTDNFEGKLDDTRRRGRSGRRWSDNIKDWTGKDSGGLHDGSKRQEELVWRSVVSDLQQWSLENDDEWRRSLYIRSRHQWAYVPHLSPSSIGQRAVALRLGSTDTMVRVWLAGKTVWSSCYTRAVSDFSLLSCATACCVVERFDLTIIKAALSLSLSAIALPSSELVSPVMSMNFVRKSCSDVVSQDSWTQHATKWKSYEWSWANV